MPVETPRETALRAAKDLIDSSLKDIFSTIYLFPDKYDDLNTLLNYVHDRGVYFQDKYSSMDREEIFIDELRNKLEKMEELYDRCNH